MTLLAQQELLAPDPRRRIIVPHGHSAWWGVDPSTTRVSIAYVTLEGARGVRTAPFERVDGPARLDVIYRETQLFVRELILAFGWPKPGLVLVEQPSGKSENPNLSYAVGVAQAALFSGLHEATYSAPRIETCTSSWWKKRGCGRGNIYKPKRGDPQPYGVLTWARANGYTGTSWDEADAWGIAEAARREVALDER